MLIHVLRVMARRLFRYLEYFCFHLDKKIERLILVHRIFNSYIVIIMFDILETVHSIHYITVLLVMLDQ